MAIEWFVYAYEKGEEQYIPTPMIMSALSPHLKKNEHGFDLMLPDGPVAVYSDWSASQTSGVMIARPLRCDVLLDVVYKVMQCGNFILFSSDGGIPIVIDINVLDELPDDMLESLKPPRLAEDFTAFAQAINEMYR